MKAGLSRWYSRKRQRSPRALSLCYLSRSPANRMQDALPDREPTNQPPSVNVSAAPPHTRTYPGILEAAQTQKQMPLTRLDFLRETFPRNKALVSQDGRGRTSLWWTDKRHVGTGRKWWRGSRLCPLSRLRSPELRGPPGIVRSRRRGYSERDTLTCESRVLLKGRFQGGA